MQHLFCSIFALYLLYLRLFFPFLLSVEEKFCTPDIINILALGTETKCKLSVLAYLNEAAKAYKGNA